MDNNEEQAEQQATQQPRVRQRRVNNNPLFRGFNSKNPRPYTPRPQTTWAAASPLSKAPSAASTASASASASGASTPPTTPATPTPTPANPSLATHGPASATAMSQQRSPATPAPPDLPFDASHDASADTAAGSPTQQNSPKSKRELELEERTARDYDTIAAQTNDLDALRNQLARVTAQARSELSLARAESQIVARDVLSIRADRDTWKDEFNRAAREAKDLHGVREHNQKLEDACQRGNSWVAELEQRLANADQENTLLKHHVAQKEADVAALHAHVDELEDQRAHLDAALNDREGLRREVDNAHDEFETLFHELGTGLQLHDYIQHVKTLQMRSLRQQDSLSSLERQITENAAAGEERKRDRKVSLGDQLHDSDMESLTDADEDITLTADGLNIPPEGIDQGTQTDVLVPISNETGAGDYSFTPIQSVSIEPVAAEEPKNETYSFSPIQSISVEPVAKEEVPYSFSPITSIGIRPIRAPKAPRPAPPKAKPAEKWSFSPISTVIDTAPIAAKPADPITVTKQPSETLSFSKINSVSIAPVAPSPEKLSLSRITSVGTAPIAPSFTPVDIWAQMPWFWKLLVFFLLGLVFYVSGELVSERYVWLAANDVTRQRVVALGMVGQNEWVAPLWGRMEDWLGMESVGLLG